MSYKLKAQIKEQLFYSFLVIVVFVVLLFGYLLLFLNDISNSYHWNDFSLRLMNYSLICIVVTSGLAIPIFNFHKYICYGVTRKNIFTTNGIVNLFTALMLSITCTINYVAQSIIFKSYSKNYIIYIFQNINLGRISPQNIFKIFIFYFSLATAFFGVSYFIGAILSNMKIYKWSGKVFFLNFLFLLMPYSFFQDNTVNRLLFSSLNNKLTNLFLQHFENSLDLRLIIIGICGFILSWPFIEKLEI